MTENDCAIAVRDWADSVIPALATARHYLPSQKTILPDVAVEVEEKSIVMRDDRFSTRDIQQAALRVFELTLAFMVENSPGADQAESEQLRSFGADLERSLLTDGTLGGRVQMASPIMRFDYRLPFVEYPDGTRGRQMTMSFPVAELVQPGDFR